MFLNHHEIERFAAQYGEHPVLGPATATLKNVQEWVDRNSDGWPYWQVPQRAVQRLVTLIYRDGTATFVHDDERPDATEAELKKALTPIKAFRTKHNATFEIVEHLTESESDVPNLDELPAARAVARINERVIGPGTPYDDEDATTNVRDLLTDVLHYCAAYGISFEALVDIAEGMVADENQNPDG